MGLGREVADAYISVHGDLSDFRRDLNKAKPMTEAMARENADAFSEAWGKQIERDVNGKWDSMVTALYSDKKLDWDRLVGKFDANGDMDKAQSKIRDFMADMHKSGAITTEEYIKQDDAIKGMLGTLKERQRLEDENAKSLDQQTRGMQMAAEANKRLFSEANAENERWARTLDGMRKNNAIADMEKDFKKLAETMNSADMAGFAKGFDNLHQARARIYEVTAAMEEQGRMSRTQSEKMQQDISDYMGAVAAEQRLEREGEAAKSKAMRDALDETNRLRAAQDNYNSSLSGMARNSHFAKMESDFRALADAMNSTDFSHFAQGSDNIEQMRQRIANTANEMRNLGRMTDTEYGLILDRVQQVNHEFDRGSDGGGNFFRTLKNGADNFGNSMGKVNNLTRGFREHLQGFAGMNVFGDMIDAGLEFIHNLDRIALSSAQVALKIGSMASLAGSSLAGLTVIAGDLGAAFGGLAVLAPAFATGLGLMLFTTGTALASLKKKFKTVFAEIKADMGEAMFTAMDPAMNKFEQELLPTLKKEMKGLATSMGLLYGAIFTGLTDAVSPEKMALMFGRLDAAIVKSQPGVKSLVKAWAVLGETGTKYFDRFATGFNDMSAKFEAFVNKAAGNGDLEKWIENGISGVKNLGRTLDGIFGIFNAIESAARKAGSGGLKEFADKLQGIAAAMQSPAFQGALTSLFTGMNTAAAKIGESIKNLGPAIESIMPSVQRVLTDIGTATGRIIDYIGMIFKNPAVQQGLTDFSNSLVSAINGLEPAMKPFGDSIGNTLTLLGKIVESVSKIATTFTVELSPVLDDMSRKMETMVAPLADGASKFIGDMKGPLQALNDQFVGPLVDAITNKLLPAITGPGGFSEEFAKFVTRIVTAAGPSFKTLVSDVLPALVKVVTELLDPMGKFIAFFTPTLNGVLKETAAGFDGIAKSIKFLKGEVPITDFAFFNPGSMEAAAAKSEADFKAAWENRGQMSWGDIFAKLVSGNGADAGQAFGAMWTEKIFPGIKNVWDNVIVKGITMIFEGRMFGDEVKKNLDNFWREDASLGADMDKNVNEWFTKNVFEPMGKLGESIGKLWDETIGAFWDTVFGGKGADPVAQGGGGGGGAGGKGMGVTGKLDPAMLGLPDQEGVSSFFTDFGTWLSDGFTGAMAALGAALGLTDFGTQWNDFWAGFGTVVSTAWDTTVLYVQTKVGEIQTNVSTFITDFQTNWTTFWDGVSQVVTDIWTNVSTWISTKVGEIQTNIGTFIAGVQLAWSTFWDGVSQKVTDIWNTITTWISTKVGEVQTNIDGFIGAVRTNWDNFWTGVSTTVTNIWNQITGWISGKVGEIRGNIDGFIGGVRGNWDSFWNGVGTTVSNAWNSITTAVSTGVTNVMSFITGLPGRISGALGGLGSLLSGAGEAIMGGLRSGLEAAWGGVQEFVGGIADWIAQHKGPISYDKTLLVPAGQAIMGGLESSMKDKFGNVMSFVSSMADKMAEAFAYSKMYVAGADAALGLAAGLKDNKAGALDAFGQLLPSQAALTIAGGVGGSTPAAGGTYITIEAGAIPVTTPTQDPALVASKVIDGFANYSNL